MIQILEIAPQNYYAPNFFFDAVMEEHGGFWRNAETIKLKTIMSHLRGRFNAIA